jgi:hypothetical protein
MCVWKPFRGQFVGNVAQSLASVETRREQSMDATTALSVALAGLGVFLGAVVSIITTILVERTRRPLLRILLADPSSLSERT